MFLIIKTNAKVLTPLQTNTNPTKTRPYDKEPPNINTSPARTKYCCASANREIEIRQLEIKIKFHMDCEEK